MAGSFKYKAFFIRVAHSFCNAALFSTFFFNPNDIEFDILFRRLFGDNAASSDLYADLQRELKIYQVMGTISVLPSLSKLVEQYLVPRLVASIGQHAQEVSSSPLTPEQIASSIESINQGKIDAIAQATLAYLLDAHIEIYTRTLEGQLFLKEKIGAGPSLIRLLETEEAYYALVSLKQLTQAQQISLGKSPVLTLKTAQEEMEPEEKAPPAPTAIMQAIWQLTDDFLKRHQRSPFRGVHLKYWDVIDIKAAQTPQAVMNLLHQKHRIAPFWNQKRYEVLAMNEEPEWLWWVKTVLIVLTLPVSVPALMIYSKINRGTFDFTKTEGALYVKEILKLCREAGVLAPTPSSEIESATPIDLMPPLATAGGYFTEAEIAAPPKPPVRVWTLGDYIAMGITPPSAADPSTSVTPAPAIPAPATTSTSTAMVLATTAPTTPTTAPTTTAPTTTAPTPAADPLVSFAEGMTRTLAAGIAMMDANPTMIVETLTRRSNGQAVFLDVPPFQRQASLDYVLQPFTYGAAWTKPWDQLDGFKSQIILFRHFSFIRRMRKTDNSPLNIVINADPSETDDTPHWLSRFLPPPDDYEALLQKARANHLSGAGIAIKFYLAAISVAKNNKECTNALEELINFYYSLIEDSKTKKKGYNATPDSRTRFNKGLQEAERRLNEFIDLLPEGYQLYSSTAYFLQTSFERVWALIERGELIDALEIFGYEILRGVSEKSKIQQLIETHFVQACLPHFVCMWHQLRAIFFLKGQRPKLIGGPESEGDGVLYHMGETLKHLEAHHLPEAVTFKRECMMPLQQMKAHVESLFNQVPLRIRLRYTKERYRDRLNCELQGLSHSYRYAERGRPQAYFHLFPRSDEEKRRDIEMIDEQLRREAGEERPSSPSRITSRITML
jgi:hypothetical protein